LDQESDAMSPSFTPGDLGLRPEHGLSAGRQDLGIHTHLRRGSAYRRLRPGLTAKPPASDDRTSPAGRQ
jgi:hypothetical protein